MCHEKGLLTFMIWLNYSLHEYQQNLNILFYELLFLNNSHFHISSHAVHVNNIFILFSKL